jgi:hypothetical protein
MKILKLIGAILLGLIFVFVHKTLEVLCEILGTTSAMCGVLADYTRQTKHKLYCEVIRPWVKGKA